MSVFITGSSRGIGRALALHFAALGRDVAINCSSNPAELDEVSKQVQTLGGRALPLFGDISDYNLCKNFFEQIITNFGKIDLLINNAAISHIGFFADMAESQWRRLLDVNLGGVLNCSHLAVPHMLARQKGRIINISSVWGQAGASCEAVYSMTKGGVNAFTKALAKELGGSGIMVNAIACGVIDTNMNNFLDEQEKQALIEQIPLKRLGRPAEVAQAADYLARAEYITGQIITLDGGFSS